MPHPNILMPQGRQQLTLYRKPQSASSCHCLITRPGRTVPGKKSLWKRDRGFRAGAEEGMGPIPCTPWNHLLLPRLRSYAHIGA